LQRRTRGAAIRAIELDGTLAEPHASLGFIRFAYDWDWPGAEAAFRRAIQLNASYPTAHHWYANFLSYMGRSNEAIVEIETARRLDPLSLIFNADSGYILHMASRHDEAIARFNSTLTMDPRFSVARWYLGMAYEQVGRVQEAIQEYEQAMRESGSTVANLSSIGYAFARAGDTGRAREILRRLQTMATKEHVDPAAFAYIHVALGEHDRALDFLERAYEERSDWLVELKVTPSLDPIRAHPRFVALLRKMSLD
jgi:adenylate cyclase